MKFGDTITTQQRNHPEWSSYYLNYIPLVQLLEEYHYNSQQQQQQEQYADDTASYASRTSSVGSIGTSSFSIFNHGSNYNDRNQQPPPLLNCWITTELLTRLHLEFEKIFCFVLQQQGIIATQLITLRQELRTAIVSANSSSSSHTTNAADANTSLNSTTSFAAQQPPPPSPSNLIVNTSNSSNNNNNSLNGGSRNPILTMNSSTLSSSTMIGAYNDDDNNNNTDDTIPWSNSNPHNSNTASTANVIPIVDYESIVQHYEELYYTIIGLPILRLYHFIDTNVTGIRKLLKKHDKLSNRNSRITNIGGRLRGGGRNRHHKLSTLLLHNNNNISSSRPNLSRSNSNSSNVAINSSNYNNVIPWSPRCSIGGTGIAGASSSSGSIGSSTNVIYNTSTQLLRSSNSRKPLSPEAYGNVLLQPLLHDEGLTALTATFEMAVQELYLLLVVQQQQQQVSNHHHTRNPSDASLDFLWDGTNNTNSYGSTNNSSNIHAASPQIGSDGANIDTLGPLLGLYSPPPPPSNIGNNKKQRGPQTPPPPQQQSLLLPPKQPSQQRPIGAQSARIQSRKTVHHRYPLRQSLSSFRSLSTGNVLTGGHSTPTMSHIDNLFHQIHIARRKLHQTNGYLQLLAAPMMMNDMDMDDDGEGIAEGDDTTLFQDETPTDHDGEPYGEPFMIDEEELHIHQSRINISNILNLGSSMLYMCNYYIVAPTSVSYAKRLGGKASMASMIIGMTPVAALVSTVLFSWWTNHSYKYALIFASACSVLGNLLYAFGLPLDSLALVMLGRLLTGFGSARAINRRYICDTFPRSERTAASAAFVTASAMGMTAGPAIASILHYITTDRDNVGRVQTLYWQNENAPGWFMVILWTVFLLLLIVYFEDPPKKKYETAMKKAKSLVECTTDDNDHETKHLLSRATTTTTPVAVVVENVAKPSSSSSVVAEKKTVTNNEPPIWRNVPVMITFLIYFVLKLILEAVLSSSAVLTEFYFHWDSGTVGWYLALLGLLVLPANAVVASLAQSYDDRELIMGIQVALFVGCLCMLQVHEVYHFAQYMVGTVLLVVSANALEGPNMSLLSQTIPKSWSSGIFNVGLLSTEAGTFGRAMGNVLLTVLGSDGLDHLLNRAFGTFSILSFLTLYVTYYFYDDLEPWDVDD